MKRLILATIMALTISSVVCAEEELVPMKATAYCTGSVTASGKNVHEGICASSKERIGLTAIVYKREPDDSVGDLIGIYEVEDTGGKGVKKGTVLDVYFTDLSRCQDFMELVGDMNVYCQFVEADG